MCNKSKKGCVWKQSTQIIKWSLGYFLRLFLSSNEPEIHSFYKKIHQAIVVHCESEVNINFAFKIK